MDGLVKFGSHDYCLMVLLLVFTRGIDILSTWIASPNLELEGNPFIKFLGWRWGIIFTLGLCFGMAFWPASAIGIATFSVMVASRNFQSAWLMRTMGEERYHQWRVARIRETPIVLYLLCLAGHTLPIAALGFAVAFYGSDLLSAHNPITAVAPLSIGIGIMGYAVAVAGFIMLAVWRLRRPTRHKSQALPAGPAMLVSSAMKDPLADSCACETGEIPGK